MKQLTTNEVLNLPFGSKIKICKPYHPHYDIDNCFAVVFGDKVGYKNGEYDKLETIANYMFENWCIVYLINE